MCLGYYTIQAILTELPKEVNIEVLVLVKTSVTYVTISN